MEPQVVITRKDKRLHKGWHFFAFVLTGGASAPVTVAKAATNHSYNRRTQQLSARGTKVKWTAEEKAYFAAHAVRPGR